MPIPEFAWSCVKNDTLIWQVPACPGCGADGEWPACWYDTVQGLYADTKWPSGARPQACLDLSDFGANPHYGAFRITVPHPCGCDCWNVDAGEPCVTKFRVSWEALTLKDCWGVDRSRPAGHMDVPYTDLCAWTDFPEEATGASVSSDEYGWNAYASYWLGTDYIFHTEAAISEFDCQTGGNGSGTTVLMQKIGGVWYGCDSAGDSLGVAPA